MKNMSQRLAFSHDFVSSVLNDISQDNKIHDLLDKLRAYDMETFNHCIRVAEYAVVLADSLSLSKEAVYNAAVAGILHDIGKIYVDARIINKPGRLTPLEYEEIQYHVVYGQALISDVSLDTQVKRGITEHHERMNETGYPYELSAPEISMFIVR